MNRHLLKDNNIDRLLALFIEQKDIDPFGTASTLCWILSRANKQLTERIFGREDVMDQFIPYSQSQFMLHKITGALARWDPPRAYQYAKRHNIVLFYTEQILKSRRRSLSLKDALHNVQMILEYLEMERRLVEDEEEQVLRIEALEKGILKSLKWLRKLFAASPEGDRLVVRLQNFLTNKTI